MSRPDRVKCKTECRVQQVSSEEGSGGDERDTCDNN